MGVSVTITDTDKGWDAYMRAMLIVDGSVVESGLHDPEEAQKGAWMEFGTKEFKPRPWMSIAADTGQEKIFRAGAKAVGVAASGGDIEKAYEKAGIVVADLAANVITSQKVGGPVLKPSTVDRKGHPAKGVDSGDMIESIEVKVFLL